MISARAVLGALAALLLLTAGQCSNQNSVSGDTIRFKPRPPHTGTEKPSFADVKAIIDNRCTKCHDEFKGRDEVAWIKDTTLVTPGDCHCSLLFHRIKGSKANCPDGRFKEVPRDMPMDEEPLIKGEISILMRWLDTMPKR